MQGWHGCLLRRVLPDLIPDEHDYEPYGDGQQGHQDHQGPGDDQPGAGRAPGTAGGGLAVHLKPGDRQDDPGQDAQGRQRQQRPHHAPYVSHMGFV